ncbi:16S rRNA (uracil(1498)-N(3))-methyltransferase [bacterium]|nr:16S rRNA (uracil(1498)-N(3))-methyltransferase [bacterium]
MKEAPVLLWPALAPGAGALRLEGAAQHYLCYVLRLRAGDAVELRDGRGGLAAARLERVTRAAAELVHGPRETPLPPAQPELHLALPLLKGRRLDWVLEKGTELGVAGFALYLGRHGVVQRETRPERYAEILRAAFMQSRRLLLPSLGGPQPFADLLADARERGWRQCWADERRAGQGDGPLPAADARPLLAWIGPEGGFAAEEREALGAVAEAALDLGPWRLRAETAALALACRLLLPVPAQAGWPR